MPFHSPRIGITLDCEGPGGFSQMPWYAIRKNYCTCISALGGIPILLPHELTLVGDYLDLIDGLMITGGGHDVPPHLYGDQEVHPTVTLKPERTAFELAITQAALAKDIPILGICGGQQLLNVALGGTLIQHIPDAGEFLNHKQPSPRDESHHLVTLVKGTLLHRLIGQDELDVNSVHHQAVRDLGKGVIVNALSPDGIIEGIEVPRYRFCLGVQWHPECTFFPQERHIFQAFIEAARG